MTNEQITATLSGKFPDIEFKQGVQFLEITVPLSKLHTIASYLKESDDLAFDYLVCLSGVDYPEHLSVIYHLESTTYNHFIVLKVNTGGRQNPMLDSVYDVWPTAEFHEREVYDLLGIQFSNHPDLRRLFLDDTWGHPLRKDYVDEIHIVER